VKNEVLRINVAVNVLIDNTRSVWQLWYYWSL